MRGAWSKRLDRRARTKREKGSRRGVERPRITRASGRGRIPARARAWSLLGRARDRHRRGPRRGGHALPLWRRGRPVPQPVPSCGTLRLDPGAVRGRACVPAFHSRSTVAPEVFVANRRYRLHTFCHYLTRMIRWTSSRDAALWNGARGMGDPPGIRVPASPELFRDGPARCVAVPCGVDAAAAHLVGSRNPTASVQAPPNAEDLAGLDARSPAGPRCRPASRLKATPPWPRCPRTSRAS
jgi:hypothetical protein